MGMCVFVCILNIDKYLYWLFYLSTKEYNLNKSGDTPKLYNWKFEANNKYCLYNLINYLEILQHILILDFIA